MNYLASVVSATVNGYRSIKAFIFGNNAIEKPEYSPMGIDSCPLPGLTALYVETVTKGKAAIVGYLDTGKLAAPGEVRLYSKDSNGNLVTYIWLHNAAGDGQIEIGGKTDNAVGYNTLNSLLQAQAEAINAQLALIAAGIAGAGGSYTPEDLSTDFTSIKKDKIVTL